MFIPSSVGGSKPNSSLSLSSGTSLVFSAMPTVRWPWTLLCPRTGQQPAPGLPDIAAQQQQVDQHRDVERAVRVLRQPHAIDADHLLGGDIDVACLAQRGFGQARFLLDLGPARCRGTTG